MKGLSTCKILNFRLAYLHVCNNINKKNCNPFPAFDLNYPTRILLLIKLPRTFDILLFDNDYTGISFYILFIFLKNDTCGGINYY